MDDSKSEQPLPGKEAIYPTAWEEIRTSYAEGSYGDYCEAAARRIKEWEKEPHAFVPQEEWENAVNAQLQKAKVLRGEHHTPGVVMTEDSAKIFAQGIKRPATGKDVLTRIYIGVDPRKATDAYAALLNELARTGILQDIDVALNLEELRDKKLAGNMVVIYEPLSRVDVLNKILVAYRQAKKNHPQSFSLSSRQKAHIVKNNIRQFKAVVDANMSFVEMAAEDRGRSYDSDIIVEIVKAFGNIDRGIESDEEWARQIKEREAGRVVYTRADQRKIEDGNFKPGDTIQYKRKLTAPALIQLGSLIVK